jgi:nucleotide-binding universal stress UspA family protein
MLRFPPRRVLAAVDSSAVSLEAWKAAREIAGRFGASLEALYCDEPEAADVAAFAGVPAADARARAAAIAGLRRRLGPEARLHVVRGDPARSILRLARERRCDLVVMGTHRRRGAARLVFGSVAAAVARDCPCPVLVLPAKMRPIRRVLAPVHEEPYAKRGLLAAGLIARAYKARLSVLTVVTDPIFGANPERLIRKLIAGLPEEVRRDARPEGEVRRTDPVSDILRAERGRDLVVLAAHRKSLLGDLVLGTTVERVLRGSRVPVLAVPTESRRGR